MPWLWLLKVSTTLDVIAVSTFFYLTPSRLRRTPPIIAGGDLLIADAFNPVTFASGKPSVPLPRSG